MINIIRQHAMDIEQYIIDYPIGDWAGEVPLAIAYQEYIAALDGPRDDLRLASSKLSMVVMFTTRQRLISDRP